MTTISSTSSLGTGLISSPGIGSGIDITSIVSQLLQADFGPQETLIQNQESTLNSKLSAFGTISSDVSSIGTALSTLADLSASYTASSSDSSVVSATSSSGAQGGTYSVNVTTLAAAQSLASTAVSSASGSIGTGTLTFQFGNYSGGTFTASGSSSGAVSITLDSSDDTLQGLATAINNAGFGVSATVVNVGSGYQLALTSSTGTNNELQITSSDSNLSAYTYDGGSSGMTQTVAAADAQYTINGISATSQSNTIADAVQDVSFTLGATGTATISVAPNVSAVTSAVQSFVTAYNSYAKDASNYASYDSSTQTAGLLLGDPTLRMLTQQLQDGVVQQVSGAPASYSTLMDLGITANSDGTLSLDTTKLTDAVNSDYSGVLTTLQGIGTQLGTVVGGMTGTGGVITARTDSINTQLTSLQDQLTALNTRMAQEKQTLMQQYNAMDTLVADLQSTSNYLTQELASLSGSSSSSTSSTTIG